MSTTIEVLSTLGVWKHTSSMWPNGPNGQDESGVRIPEGAWLSRLSLLAGVLFFRLWCLLCSLGPCNIKWAPLSRSASYLLNRTAEWKELLFFNQSIYLEQDRWSADVVWDLASTFNMCPWCAVTHVLCLFGDKEGFKTNPGFESPKLQMFESKHRVTLSPDAPISQPTTVHVASTLGQIFLICKAEFKTNPGLQDENATNAELAVIGTQFFP
ncbi:hypothetical protein B0H14DRAFT_2623068 [Mycena olivaceomarginata]|nr:hypothetical protein B0H14DRAFT_2623068 [Mycena olivaceomarginata]